MALIARESEEDGVDDGGGLRIIFPETLSENDIFRPFVEKNRSDRRRYDCSQGSEMDIRDPMPTYSDVRQQRFGEAERDRGLYYGENRE